LRRLRRRSGRFPHPSLSGVIGESLRFTACTIHLAASRSVYSRRRTVDRFDQGNTDMSAYTFRSSRPDQWVSPRPTRDPARLAAIHGPLRPMHDEPRLLSRLLGLR